MHDHRQIQVRAPLLYLLVGILAGLLLSQQFQPQVVQLLSTSLLLGLIGIIKHRIAWQWAIYYLTAATLLFWAYGLLRLPHAPNNTTLTLPEREAELVLDVKRIFGSESPYGSTSGIAMIRDAPELSRIQKGASIYFRLKPGVSSKLTIQRGQWRTNIGDAVIK